MEAARREIKRLERRLAEVEEEREILKKTINIFLPEKRMRYQYIREHRMEHSVKRMCELLDVTRSGYYAWHPEERACENWKTRCYWSRSEWNTKVAVRRYGSPRIRASLLRQGIACGRHRVARLMHKAGLSPQKRHRWHPMTTRRRPGADPGTQPSEPRLFCNHGQCEMGQ